MELDLLCVFGTVWS